MAVAALLPFHLPGFSPALPGAVAVAVPKVGNQDRTEEMAGTPSPCTSRPPIPLSLILMTPSCIHPREAVAGEVVTEDDGLLAGKADQERVECAQGQAARGEAGRGLPVVTLAPVALEQEAGAETRSAF